MPTIKSQPSPLWSALIFVPPLLVTVSLIPKLGRYNVGLAPEWFLHQIRGFEDFGGKAVDVRWSMVAVFLLVVAAAVAWWVATLWGWRARLQTFEVPDVAYYRAFVAWKGLGTFITAMVVAGAVVTASPALQAGGLQSWVIFAMVMGVLGILQFFAFVLGLRGTMRLYRGY